jgi:beta-lactamase class A
MGIFKFLRKKKKEKDFDEALIKQEKIVRKKKSKKKEEEKPWGRRERFLIVFLIILTSGIPAYLALSAREWKLPFLPRISFESIRNVFKNEGGLFLTDKYPEQSSKAKQIDKIFREETKKLSGIYGMYLIDLETGFSFGVNQNEKFDSASLNKLPVMILMLKKSEEDALDLSDKYYLKDSDKVEGAGVLHQRPEGYQITYEEIVFLMGKQSDNTAFRIAVGYLGEDAIEAYIKEIGLDGTSFYENKTTPADTGQIFNKLYNDELLTEKNKFKMLDYLADTAFEDLIPKGVPRGVKISHKYGALTKTANDAGIVFASKPFVLAVLSKGIVKNESDVFFPQITSKIYEIWVN